jgi:hypothetical protein
MTAGYAGGRPSTWDLSLPDLTAASGFNVAWMPSAGATTLIIGQAFSGKPELVLSIGSFPGIGADPVVGDVVSAGYHEVFLNANQVALRAGGTYGQFPLLHHPRVPQPGIQYFRR